MLTAVPYAAPTAPSILPDAPAVTKSVSPSTASRKAFPALPAAVLTNSSAFSIPLAIFPGSSAV